MAQSLIVQNLKHNKIIHSDVAILHFKTENVQRVPNFDKVKSEKLGGGFFQIIAHHGFMEEPKISMILALAHEQGLNVKLEEASYYLGHEKLSISSDPAMSRRRSDLSIPALTSSIRKRTPWLTNPSVGSVTLSLKACRKAHVGL